jgi:hypothetical protein
MTRATRFRTSLRSRAGFLLLLLPALLLIGSCDDDDDGISLAGPYTLKFSLGADYQEPHGNQPVEWALIRSADGVELDAGSGTVSATRNPAFTLTTGRVLELGVDYQLRYWIDSNTGGGTPGVCDAETIDHQWNWRFTAPDDDLNVTLVYDEERVEDVCDTFVP